jgi:RNA-directed DNA polymerase
MTDLFPTDEGTPQGGVLSPLLANVALHGMENFLKEYISRIDMRNKLGRQQSWQNKTHSLTIIRYADDVVVLHKDHQVIKECKELLEGWLKEIGLEFKESKT